MAEIYVACHETVTVKGTLLGIVRTQLRHPSIFGIGFTVHEAKFLMDPDRWREHRRERAALEDRYRIQVEQMKAMFAAGHVSQRTLLTQLSVS